MSSCQSLPVKLVSAMKVSARDVEGRREKEEGEEGGEEEMSEEDGT